LTAICGLLDLGGLGNADAALERMIFSLTGDGTAHVERAGGAGGRIALIAHPDDIASPARRERPTLLQQGERIAAATITLCDWIDAPHDARARSGLAVIDEAIQRAGPMGLDLCDGEFAGAHWDAGCRRLCLFKDHAGTQPLFFAWRARAWLAFASMPRALIAGGFTSGEIDRELIARWSFTFEGHGTKTHFQGVERVLPGHVLVCENGACRQVRYWTPCLDPLETDPGYAEVTHELGRRLDRAVRRRLPRTGLAGAHLSGGLDSTGIAALAARAMAEDDRRLQAYAFAPAEIPGAPEMVTELPAVEATCAMHRTIDLTYIACSDTEIEPLQGFSPEFPHPLATSPYAGTLRRAAADGVTHMLAGFGGDEAASYSGRSAVLDAMSRHPLRALRLPEVARRANWYGIRPLLQVALRSLVPSAYQALLRRRRRAWKDYAMMAAFLRQDLRWDLAEDPAFGSALPASHVGRDMFALFSGGRLGLTGEELAWRAAPFGITYTFPLMDRQLVEYAFRIPAHHHLHRAPRRIVYRDALAGVLPDSVRLRPTKLLANPTGAFNILRMRGAYRAAVDEMAGSEAEEVFDLDALRRAVDALPAPEAIAAQIAADRDRGIQTVPPGLQFLWPFGLARYLASRMRSAETP